MVRKEILGTTERKIVEAYLSGERLKGYQTVLWRIRSIGLKAIVEGCERDLALLKRLMKTDS
ncbi:MAG: hypothetical protein WB643_03765 [Candidatus Bathyarchaeia archaeon]